MRGLDRYELEMLRDALVDLSQEELDFDCGDEDKCTAPEEAAVGRLVTRGLATVNDHEFLDITPRGRLALACHHAVSLMKGPA